MNGNNGITHYYETNGSKVGFLAQPDGGHFAFNQHGRQIGASTCIHSVYVSMY